MKKILILSIILIAPALSYSAVSLAWSFTAEDALKRAEKYMQKNEPMTFKKSYLHKIECLDCDDVFSRYVTPHWRITYQVRLAKGGQTFITINRSGEMKVMHGE